jgi:hypothetical protein
MLIAQEAFDLIVTEEVSSEATYRRKYRRPVWPGGASGITIGVGYDLGYMTREQLWADWRGHLSTTMITALEKRALGIRGAAAKARLKELQALIDVPWEAALAVYRDCVLPRYVAKLRAALPNTDRLGPECLGALASLCINRGFSFTRPEARYAEMRAIRAHMEACDFEKIPDELRAMKRLWPAKSGLRPRREHEAVLFERGLKKLSGATVQPAAFAVLPDRPGAADEPDAVDPTPDPELKSVQEKLIEQGYYEVGAASGIGGARTDDAIRAFRKNCELPDSTDIDEDLKSALMDPTNHRPIAPERATMTADDLRESGSSTITLTDRMKTWAGGLFGAGLVGSAGEGGGVVDKVTDGATRLSGFKEAMNGLGIGLGAVALLAVAGFVVWLIAHKIEQNRVHEARIGKNL